MKARNTLITLLTLLAVGILTTGTALASGKPFVETKPATSIGETKATLNGVVNPNGAETKYWFEYGTTTSYGKKTTEVSVGSGITNLEESQAITGLAVGALYHFRIVAKNSVGTSDGSDQRFATTEKEALPELGGANITSFSSPVTFTGEGGGVRLEWSGFRSENCNGLTSITGEFISRKHIANAVVTWTTCNNPYECGNNGAKETVTSEPLTGTLGYINKAKKEVGLMFGAEYTSGTKPTWASRLTCSSYGVTPLGELIVPITPVNAKALKLKLTENGREGRQEVTQFEGGAANQQLYWKELTQEPVPFSVRATAELERFTQGKGSLEVEIKA
jgi:hypothetical protein